MLKTGKRVGTEQWTKLVRNMMDEPAWRALSASAQALYSWLKFEWHGPDNNNNGKIRLSVRQAAEKVGIGINAAARGFHQLQAKGFIVVTEDACLGYSEQAKSPAYELTEIPLLTSQSHSGRRLYKNWSKTRDFPIQKGPANNPSGANGKIEPCHQNEDGKVINMKKVWGRTSSK